MAISTAIPVSNDRRFSAPDLLRLILALTKAAARTVQYRTTANKVAPISMLTAPTNGLAKAVDALTQTEFARDWVEIGRTCKNIHRQGTNRTMKAAARSRRENRVRA